MTIHAFIDESRRGNQYLMAVALVDPANLEPVRKRLRQLLLRGERELHFYKQNDRRRRELSEQVARLPFTALVYTSTCRRADEPARRACLTQLTNDLLARKAHRMVLDSRESRDHDDRAVIKHLISAEPGHPQLVYEHFRGQNEPLLWLADIVAWCWGAGPGWRKRVDAIIEGEIDLG